MATFFLAYLRDHLSGSKSDIGECQLQLGGTSVASPAARTPAAAKAAAAAAKAPAAKSPAPAPSTPAASSKQARCDTQ
jgi:hypothetical protein